MKLKILATLMLLLALSSPTWAFELATKISQTGNTVNLESVGYAKLNLLKEVTSLTGSIISTGTLSVKGTANIVMWAKVEGRYYFSKVPALQNIKDKSELVFNIPFNSGDKKISEVIIEVEMLTEGSVSISDLSVKNG